MKMGVVSILKRHQALLLGAAALILLYASLQYSYLLFHTLVELFSIVVAFSIFVIAWNARRLYDNEYLLVVGIQSLFVGSIDLLHTLAYKGMGVFIGYDANLPTQLWIAARGLESISLLIAPLLLGTRIRAHALLAVYVLVTALLLGSIFVWAIFPVCFVDQPGGGLTAFKITSEYVICAILLVGLILLRLKRERFDPEVFRYLTLAVVVTIAAEVSFTAYVSVYGPANMLGHLFKLFSFYFLYKAIIQTALSRPLNLLFRELKQREQDLLAARELQEQMTQFLVHDLRSPLTTVIAGISSLQDRQAEMDADDKDILASAVASSAWLKTLADAFLDISRLESGKFPVRQAACSIKELIDSSLEKVSAWANTAQIEIDVKISPEAQTVFADQGLTIRILVNLLSNAIKFSPPDSTVTLKIFAFEENSLAFSVTDQGPGIPEEWSEEVFNRFSSARARQAGVPGTGLGLNFCRNAVEAQGGRIWIDRSQQKGATIVFTLPIEKKSVQAV